MKKTVIFTDEPYFACLDCSHRAAGRCNGPRTSGMEHLDWCKFMRALKERSGITNQEIAMKSGVSIKTIEKIMALNCDHDIMRDTARLIEDAIIGASTSYPCYLAFEENLPDVSQRVSNALRDMERTLDEQHLAALDNLRNSHAAEMLAIKAAQIAELNAVREEANVKIQYLKALVERLQREKDSLWAENTRKSRIIDRLIEVQEALMTRHGLHLADPGEDGKA